MCNGKQKMTKLGGVKKIKFKFMFKNNVIFKIKKSVAK